MRVLHLSSERTWRGGEQQMAYLIEESEKLGVHNFVAARKGSAFEGYCLDKNIPLISLGFKNEFHIPTSLGIKSYCEKNKIDIIHMHSSHSHALGVLSDLMGNKAKLILSRKVDFAVKKNFASKFKFNYKGINAIICVSNAIKEIVSVDLKRKDILYVAHDGISLERFSTSKDNNTLHEEFLLNREQKIVANISAVADHKDYFTFVDTAALILEERKDVTFFIIGDGPMFSDIEKYIKERNLQKNIVMTGFRDDIPDIIREIDVFLMSSKTEGLGSTILDAFANHIPMVATQAGGIPEIVNHNDTGLTAAVKDSKKLAVHVGHLLDNPGLAEALSNNAYSLLLRKFTKDKMALANVAIYKKVLK
jgi:glycosyltransferase involved in cell wall biosynthesis